MSIKSLKKLPAAASKALYDAAHEEVQYFTEDQHRRGVDDDTAIVSRLMAVVVTLVGDAEDDRGVLDDNIKIAVDFIRTNAKKSLRDGPAGAGEQTELRETNDERQEIEADAAHPDLEESVQG
jgi:hypothetical protein